METIYLGRNNRIDRVLKNQGVAYPLDTMTKIELIIGETTVSSTNQAGDKIRWSLAGYATGEIRCSLGLQTGLVASPIQQMAQIVCYDSGNPDGIIWDSFDVLILPATTTNRVTGSEVLLIIETTLQAYQIEPLISAANKLVTAKCAGFYTDDELKEIERWLSAHFVAVRDPSQSVVEKQIGEAREKYGRMKTNPGRGLEATPYGQQVLMLDYKGRLGNLGSTPASISAWGATNNEDFS